MGRDHVEPSDHHVTGTLHDRMTEFGATGGVDDAAVVTDAPTATTPCGADEQESTQSAAEAGWTAFFVWKSLHPVREECSPTWCAGTVVSLIDAYHTRVVVDMDGEDGGRSCEAHVPAHDRFPGMLDVVTQCQDTCRVRVTTCGVHVLLYEFSVNSAKLRVALESGDMVLYEILLRVCRNMPPNARVVHLSTAQHVEDSAATTHLNTWRDIKLLASQEESLKWMQSVEERVINDGCLICDGEATARFPGTEWYYDFTRLELHRDVVPPRNTMRFTGAILGNDMGTGKTATVLRLICEDQTLQHRDKGPASGQRTQPTGAEAEGEPVCQVGRGSDPPQADPRPPVAALGVPPRCESETIAGSPRQTLPAELPPRPIATDGVGGRTGLPVAKGTLVILPPNLQFQWAAEIAKFTQNLHVLSMSERANHTMQDLLGADIVLCTWQHLRAPAYASSVLDLFQRLSIRLTNAREALRDAGLTSGIARAVETRSKWSHAPAIVELASWRRIVLDEVHEYFIDGGAARERRRTVECLRGRLWWGVSGTPVGDAEQMRRMIAFFAVGAVSLDPHAHPMPTIRLFEEHALRRHAFDWTGVRHVVHDVHLTAHERIMLQCNAEAAFEERICISSGAIQADNVDALSVEAQCAAFLSDMQKRVHQMQERVYYIEGAREKGTRAIAIDENRLAMVDEGVRSVHHADAAPDSVRGDAIRGSIRQHKKNVAACVRSSRVLVGQLASLQARHEYLRSRVELIAKHDQRCAKCLTVYASSMTPCGHAFCIECLTASQLPTDANARRGDWQPEQACPACQAHFSVPAQLSLTERGGRVPPAKWSCLLNLLNKLVSLAHERVVVFVPWRKTHRALRRTLESCTEDDGGHVRAQLSVRVLEGSSCRRSAELQRFNESVDGAVLLLCFEDSIAGLNLTCSRHVVLFAPLCCDTQAAQNIESQAIARVARMGQTREVTVHHLITVASCEEDLWRSQHQSRQYWRQ
tara:strand:- start:956 stop:3907 length:2952 start_codon:yes stop_codon:yes gene_type:complete